MNIPELVDELYEAFAQGLGGPTAERARDLPRALRLAPEPNLRWSRVFGQEVTLGAPALFADAMGAPSDLVRDAVLAHTLAVIDAFGNDRIEDEQVAPTPELMALLGRMRRERDRALVRMFGGPPLPELGYAPADSLSLRAMRRERATLLTARPVDMATYESAALDKQSLGIVASTALARLSGWDERHCRAVRATLESVTLGLQILRRRRRLGGRPDARGRVGGVRDERDATAVAPGRSRDGGRGHPAQRPAVGGPPGDARARVLSHAGRTAACERARRVEAGRVGRRATGALGGALARRGAERGIHRPGARAVGLGRRGPGMRRRRVDWDFPYEPVPPPQVRDAGGEPLDAVVATDASLDPATVRRALRGFADLAVDPVLDRAPLHWTRVRSRTPASERDVAAMIARTGATVRYVAPARRSSMQLGPTLALDAAPRVDPSDWRAAPAEIEREAPAEDGSWFLGASGVHVERSVCGTGRGVRLAVVDDDVADVERVMLERVVPVGLEALPAASGHGALMVGWAVGARRPDGSSFVGVAPEASARLYCIPKPGDEVVSLPLAIARAVLDGADVVVCATYVEGTTSPMLDDALDVAAHLGRGGLGSAVVLPTGRETSSPRGSLHASFSLAFGDPASDPRVHCVAPAGRDGGWFLWRDARGKLRPFANRGPAVRWLSPGDDLAYPLAARDRLFHAESSGASAVAAGVIALVLACNPGLSMGALHAVLARTTDDPEASLPPTDALEDPADVLPAGRDADGHDAKCGYGRLNASRACVAASDPFALALTAMGDDAVAAAWCTRGERLYSRDVARWATHALLVRGDLDHAVRSVVRHARLLSTAPVRARVHAAGALSRQLRARRPRAGARCAGRRAERARPDPRRPASREPRRGCPGCTRDPALRGTLEAGPARRLTLRRRCRIPRRAARSPSGRSPRSRRSSSRSPRATRSSGTGTRSRGSSSPPTGACPTSGCPPGAASSRGYASRTASSPSTASRSPRRAARSRRACGTAWSTTRRRRGEAPSACASRPTTASASSICGSSTSTPRAGGSTRGRRSSWRGSTRWRRSSRSRAARGGRSRGPSPSSRSSRRSSSPPSSTRTPRARSCRSSTRRTRGCRSRSSPSRSVSRTTSPSSRAAPGSSAPSTPRGWPSRRSS